MLKKMNTLQKHLLVLMITAVPLFTFVQSNFAASVADSTGIRGQFEYLYNKSNTYQQYKVIPITAYNTLKQNATDSIGMYKKEATDHLPVSYTHLRAHETRHDLVCR